MLALVLSTVLTAVPAQGATTPQATLVSAANAHGTAMLAEPRNEARENTAGDTAGPMNDDRQAMGTD